MSIRMNLSIIYTGSGLGNLVMIYSILLRILLNLSQSDDSLIIINNYNNYIYILYK